MTLPRISALLAVSTLAFGCAPPPAENGDQSSDVRNTASKPHAPPSPDPTPMPTPMPMPGAGDHTGSRPSGSLVWNQSLEGTGAASGTTPVLDSLLLRADGSMAGWISTAVDGTPQVDTQLFHGTYTFSKRAKTATDAPPIAYPVDDSYEDVANGAKDTASAYLIVLALSTGTTQTYAYYLETDGTWHLRNVATNVWMGLNPPTNSGTNVTYCELPADCTTGTCTAPSPGVELTPSTCQ